MLGPLVQAAETGIATGKHETALSSPQAPIPLPRAPDIASVAEQLQRVEF